MYPAKMKALWEILEMEAPVRLYFDREGFVASGPGIIITGGLGHIPKKRGDHYSVLFGQGLGRECFNKFKDACNHALDIVDKANRPITLRVEGRSAKRFLRVQKKREPDK